MLNFGQEFRMLFAKFVTICAAANPSLDIVNCFFDNPDLLASNPCLNPDDCYMAAYAIAHAPSKLRSPNTWISIISKTFWPKLIISGSFFFHFYHFFTTQYARGLSHETLESQITGQMVFPVMVAEEIIWKGSYIDVSFCKIVRLVSFFTSDGISIACKSLSFLQDKPSIFVSFNFTSHCCPIPLLKFDHSHLL